MEVDKKQRVLDAARTIFLRHGFRRVTMQDIAEQAGISRPALYLIFSNKEDVFLAAIRDLSGDMIRAIREGLPGQDLVEDKLRFAFEIWSVQTFELMLSSPDARDLIECVHGFARPAMLEMDAEFEAVLTEILKEHGDGQATSALGRLHLSIKQVSRLLAASSHGFKEAAAGVDDFRTMIHGQIALTTAALRA